MSRRTVPVLTRKQSRARRAQLRALGHKVQTICIPGAGYCVVVKSRKRGRR